MCHERIDYLAGRLNAIVKRIKVIANRVGDQSEQINDVDTRTCERLDDLADRIRDIEKINDRINDRVDNLDELVRVLSDRQVDSYQRIRERIDHADARVANNAARGDAHSNLLAELKERVDRMEQPTETEKVDYSEPNPQGKIKLTDLGLHVSDGRKCFFCGRDIRYLIQASVRGQQRVALCSLCAHQLAREMSPPG